MSKEILIAVKQLVRNYGDYCAVDNVSFTINRGEVLGFLGPNGAGKTTTMQIISGVLPPHAGSVAIAGIDVQAEPRAAKQHLGFLPEQPPLYPDLTVDEFLGYAGRLRGINSKQIKNSVIKARKRCGLSDCGSRLIRNLSKGYQQRVGIAQAIIHSPAVVILDEPTSGLDPIQIKEIRDMIKELGADHSVLLSTHILPEVQTVCDRVIIINQGKLVMDRDLKELGENQKPGKLRVNFIKPPTLQELQDIQGIAQVEAISSHQYSLSLDAGNGSIDKLLQRSLDAGWGLQELVPESNSLEEVFMQVTSGTLTSVSEQENAET